MCCRCIRRRDEQAQRCSGERTEDDEAEPKRWGPAESVGQRESGKLTGPNRGRHQGAEERGPRSAAGCSNMKEPQRHVHHRGSGGGAGLGTRRRSYR